MIHHSPTFSLYFGSAQDALFPADYLALPANTPLLEKIPYNSLKNTLNIRQLYFLRQTHSTIGYRVEEAPLLPAFAHEGDFLITARKNTGIGIMTADCLPIIMVDQKNHQLAIIHAGWKGSVAQIALQTLKKMAADPHNLQIFFGPGARVCCYEVDTKFVHNIPENLREKVLQERAGKWFFDLPGFNAALLSELGITTPVNTDYHFCTLCDTRFFSHRRQAAQAGRQMTVAALR